MKNSINKQPYQKESIKAYKKKNFNKIILSLISRIKIILKQYFIKKLFVQNQIKMFRIQLTHYIKNDLSPFLTKRNIHPPPVSMVKKL